LKDLYEKVSCIVSGCYKLEKRDIRSFGNFIDTFSKYFQTTFGDIFLTFSDKKLTNWLQRIKVTLIILFVRFVYVYERIRLMAGGESRR
jgi:hypothetical protein